MRIDAEFLRLKHSRIEHLLLTCGIGDRQVVLMLPGGDGLHQLQTRMHLAEQVRHIGARGNELSGRCNTQRTRSSEYEDQDMQEEE